MLVIILCACALAGAAYLFLSLQTPAYTASPQGNTYGMSEYSDNAYGFSFWYPSAMRVSTTTTQDTLSFPGGVAVETIQIGSRGGTSLIVVRAPTGTITDEPANHASPMFQTKYFYDSASGRWMVAFPQGRNDRSSSATTTANISKTTMSGLLMLPSARRFDTSIIPLSTTLFLVVSDGGGSDFTSQLAKTVSHLGTPVSASLQGAALQAEAASYRLGYSNSNPLPVLPAQPTHSNLHAVVLGALSASSSAPGGVIVLRGSGFTGSNTILMDGNVAAKDVRLSSFTNGSQEITFTIPRAVGPDCNPGEVCPLYLRALTPGTYAVSVKNINGVSNALPLKISP